MADELLPCPFCGGTVRLYHGLHTRAECEYCGASSNWQANGPAAISAWNKRTPARANAEKMLSAFKVARVSYCKDNCLWRNDLDKHTPECLEMQSIIAAAEGRGDNDAG